MKRSASSSDGRSCPRHRALTLILLLTSSCCAPQPPAPAPRTATTSPPERPPRAPRPTTPSPPAAAAPPAQADCLLRAYPDHLCGFEDNAILWCDGTRMRWDDGRDKPRLADRLADPDLQDTMAQAYPPGPDYPTPEVDHDPGRVRHEPLLRKMYGHDLQAVRRQTATISWPGGQKLRVSTVNDVHRRLERVGRALQALPPDIARFATPSAGTLNWRTISGTSRLSAHAFAIAIDIAVDRSDYWRWSRPDAQTGRYPYKNRFPTEIVEAFEREGFIWGGKWYHYDTMHFEYRPELLLCATPPTADAD